MRQARHAARQYRDLWFPIVTVLAVVMLMFFISNNPNVDRMARGMVGPTTWPRVMLLAVLGCALILLGLRLWHRREEHRRKQTSLSDPTQSASSSAIPVRTQLGILMVLVYGLSLPWLGFAFATVVYLISWFVLGGIRRPLMVSVVSVLGTIVFLFLFVKLASMPLDRGTGWINDLTVGFYRLLKIY